VEKGDTLFAWEMSFRAAIMRERGSRRFGRTMPPFATEESSFFFVFPRSSAISRFG